MEKLRSICRFVSVAFTVALGLADPLTLTAGQETVAAAREFAIPPQPLKDALLLFVRQAGVAVLHPPLPPELMSPGVSGRMTAPQALDRLLAGTGLEVAATPRQPEGGFALRPVRRESL